MPFPLRISTSKSIKKNIFGLSGIIISATPSPHIFSQMPNFSIDLLIGSCLIAPKVYSYRYAVNSLKYKLIRIVYIGWIQYIVKLFITLIGHFFWKANWVMRNPIIDHPCTGGEGLLRLSDMNQFYISTEGQQLTEIFYV